MNTNKIVLGVLGGLAAGAIAGILLAPDKGSKTRKKIVSNGKNLSGDMKSKFEDLYENVTDKYETLLKNTKKEVAKNQLK